MTYRGHPDGGLLPLAPQGPRRGPGSALDEITSLDPEALLLADRGFRVLWFRADQAPALLRELGRERERTFRQVGEGTGHPLDLDRWDETYHHLVLWDDARDVVAGAYRLGPVAELAPSGDPAALYTRSCFSYTHALVDRLKNGVELGRSFIAPEHQRSFAPLLLLWRGVGAWLGRNPDVHLLFGALSVPATYSPETWADIAGYLLSPDRRAPWTERVSALRPFVGQSGPVAADLRELEARVKAREGRRPPILLKHYLQLGMRGLAAGTDPAFGGCLDVLCVADLRSSPATLMQRYMGPQAHARFLERHGAVATA